MFYAQRIVPRKPKKLPWYGRWSNRCLIFFTTFFILIGLGLAAVGIAMVVLNDVLSRDEVKAMLDMTQFNGNLRVGSVLMTLPILNIYVGVIVAYLGIFACIARGKRNKICLIVVSVLILWFLIVQVISHNMWVEMREKFEDEDVKRDLETQFEQYMGVDCDNTSGWDILHLGFRCCSLHDISSSDNETFKVTEWWDIRTTTIYNGSSLDLIPTSCCWYATEDTYKTFTSFSCERALITHHKQNCYDEIVSWLRHFWTPSIGLCVTLVIIEPMLIFLLLVFCCGVRQSREIIY